MSPRTGRPTDNPKRYEIKVRATKEDREKLLYCCEKAGMTQYEAVTQGINEVYNKIRATEASDIKPAKDKDYSDPLYDASREVVRTMDMFVEEFEVNFDDAIDLLEFIIRNYQEILSADENQSRLESMLKKSAERIEELKRVLQ